MQSLITNNNLAHFDMSLKYVIRLYKNRLIGDRCALLCRSSLSARSILGIYG
jgi:hypothetical protein